MDVKAVTRHLNMFTLSSVSVITNALRLRKVRLAEDEV